VYCDECFVLLRVQEGPTLVSLAQTCSTKEVMLPLPDDFSAADITFRSYESEADLPALMAMVDVELSEPYTVFTYRYFVNLWPKLSVLAYAGERLVGCIVCKLEPTPMPSGPNRGYIAMLVVDRACRKMGMGTQLVEKALARMREAEADLCVLETEASNKGALALYERLGFVRDKRLAKYYLNGGDAFRLKLWFTHDLGETQAE
jgi:peptide alpha-N-acetyltransferase